MGPSIMSKPTIAMLMEQFEVLFLMISAAGTLEAVRGGLAAKLQLDPKKSLGLDAFKLPGLPFKKSHFKQALKGRSFAAIGAVGQRQFESVLQPIYGEQAEEVIGVAAFTTEVTKMHQVEQSLDRIQHETFIFQHLRSLSQTLNGISHEINNPLAIISGYAQNLVVLVGKTPPDKEALRKVCQRITEACQRCHHIIESLKIFAQDAKGDASEETSVRGLLDQILELFEARLASLNIALRVSYIPKDLDVYCRRIEIMQGINNLILNAIDACMHEKAPVITIDIVDSDPWVQIAISDNGPGIAPSIRNKIFEPFFTTKEVGKGAGIGLSWCKGVFESNHGQITVDEGLPTTFVVRLPKRAFQLVA